MRLTVLGLFGQRSRARFARLGLPATAGDTRLLLDLGNGSFGALQRHLDPWLLDAVVLSHLHADHCADMTNLVVHRRYHPHLPAAVAPLPVFGAGRHRDPARRSPTPPRRRSGSRPTCPTCWRSARRPTAAMLGDVTLRTAPVAHPVEAYAVRVEHGGASLVYSGDTGPCAALVELAAGADVLLCEASWPHVVPGRWTEPPGGLHMSGRQAGEHAAAAGVGRLLLTHVPDVVRPGRAARRGAGAFRRAGRAGRARRDLRGLSVADAALVPGSPVLCQTATEPAWPIHTTRPVTTSPASAASTPRQCDARQRPVRVVTAWAAPGASPLSVRPPADEHRRGEQGEEHQCGQQQRARRASRAP